MPWDLRWYLWNPAIIVHNSSNNEEVYSFFFWQSTPKTFYGLLYIYCIPKLIVWPYVPKIEDGKCKLYINVTESKYVLPLMKMTNMAVKRKWIVSDKDLLTIYLRHISKSKKSPKFIFWGHEQKLQIVTIMYLSRELNNLAFFKWSWNE